MISPCMKRDTVFSMDVFVEKGEKRVILLEGRIGRRKSDSSRG